MNSSSSPPVIGLALGSGASRGWSHIGVIKALLRAGIEPDIVCGTSVGAMVGGAYVAGNLDALERWVLGASRSDVLRFFDFKLSQVGFVNTEKMDQFLQSHVAAADVRIEDMHKKFVAVCTDLDTGREVWCKDGGLVDAVRASMAMPGLFPAVRDGQRWLVDGGLVNPVPVTACRALGADTVIGVNLNSDIVGKRIKKREAATALKEEGVLGSLKKQAKEYSNSLFAQDSGEESPPGLFDTITGSINIFQREITQRQLASDPADVLISPKLADIGILEFQRAAEAIEKGEDCANSAMAEIRRAAGKDI